MFSLQISCIVILCFLLTLFLTRKNYSKGTHKLYIALLIVSILEILFEIFAIYSIQNIAAFSPILFKTIHRAYLTLVLTFFYLQFRYKSAFVFEETENQEKGISFIHVAQVILYAGIFLLPLGYEVTSDGPEFAYGPGVWIVYVGAAFYLFVVFSNYCEQMRRIAKEKLFPLVLGVACGMVTCFYYMADPLSEISGVGIVIMAIAMFISIQASDNAGEKGSDCSECRRNAEKGEVLCQVSFEAPQARVLIVDDSEMNRKVLRNLLQKTKMQMDEAAGGKECLELVRQNKYHLIFMDHLMPEMDGLETFDALKNEHLCDDVPVVAMTANALSMTEEDYMALGFAAYATKPILPEKLNLLVYKLLDKALLTSVETKEVTVQAVEEKTEPAAEEKQTEAQESWEEMPLLDGLDYSYAALHFQNPAELRDMIRFLVEVMKPDVAELQDYYQKIEDTQNLQNFRTKVHSMKNSAMTVGIVPLAGLAKTLEDAAKESNAEQICSLMPVFEEKWEKYRLLLSEKFAADSLEKIQAEPSSEEVQELFGRLRQAAEDMDIDELDAVMQQLDGYVFPEQYDEKMQQIRLAVMNFDVAYLQEEGYL